MNLNLFIDYCEMILFYFLNEGEVNASVLFVQRVSSSPLCVPRPHLVWINSRLVKGL